MQQGEEVVVQAMASLAAEKGAEGEASQAARKVMVVADPSRESTGALEYVLTHALLDHDELILLHVEPAGSSSSSRGALSFLKRGASPSMGAPMEVEFLEAMKMQCEKKQPKVRVQLERVEMTGKDKGSTILWHTKVLSVDLLVIGQRRNSPTLLGRRLSGGLTGKAMDTAEYCIENSKCLCVGVSKKGQNAGYLLNTKTHKNFWLLA